VTTRKLRNEAHTLPLPGGGVLEKFKNPVAGIPKRRKLRGDIHTKPEHST
jgi:hypothetical protein